MADTHTLDGTLKNLGLTMPARILNAYVRTNTTSGDPVVDATNEVVQLGTAKVTVNATAGTWSVGLVDTDATDLNVEPGELRYQLVVKYLDLGTRQDDIYTSGWFELTEPKDFAALVLNTSTTLARTYGEVLGERIDGVTDHGDVSGAVTIDPAVSTHWLDATGPTVLTIGDGPTGGTRYVSILPLSGASDITMTEPADAELSDGTFSTFAWVRGAWILASSGSSGPADTTPPTAITDLTATGGAGEIVLDWSAATDAESSVSYRYRAWPTSGGPTGAWTTTTATAATITGLAAGVYTAEVYAYSAGGASATDTESATVTALIGYNIGDDFTGSNGSINGRVTPVGAKTWVTPWETGLGLAVVEILANKAKGPASGGGAARVETTQQNYSVGCTYDVSGASFGRQVRVYARSNSTAADLTATASICAYIRGDGTVRVDFGNDYPNTITVVTGQPTTGTFTLEVVGSTGRILIDGTQVGSTFSIPTGITGTWTGISFNDGGFADDFQVDYL